MADQIYMSAEGYAKLEAELQRLKSEDRPAVVQAIADARDKGDLSENAEYDAAREAQGLLELKIAKLEQTLAKARAVLPADCTTKILFCFLGILAHTEKASVSLKEQVSILAPILGQKPENVI